MNSNIASPMPVVKPKGFSHPIQLGQMYTTGQITSRLRISPNTLKQWVQRGLRVYHPKGAKSDFYFAEDVMEFVRMDGLLVAAPIPAPAKKRKGKE